jgi:ankyrin repeat protein
MVKRQLPQCELPVFISYASVDFRIANELRDAIAKSSLADEINLDQLPRNPIDPELTKALGEVGKEHEVREAILLDTPHPQFFPPDLGPNSISRMSMLMGFRGDAPKIPDGWAPGMPGWMAWMALRMGEANSLVFVCTPNSVNSENVIAELDWFSRKKPGKVLWIARVNGTVPPEGIRQNLNVREFEYSTDTEQVLARTKLHAQEAEKDGRREDANTLWREALALLRFTGGGEEKFVPVLNAMALNQVKLGARYLAVENLKRAVNIARSQELLLWPALLINLAEVLVHLHALPTSVSRHYKFQARQCWQLALKLIAENGEQLATAMNFNVETLMQSCEAGIGYTDDPAVASPLRPQDNLAVRAGLGDESEVAKLLAAKSDPNQQDATGESALALAAHSGRGDILKQLLDAGARPDGANGEAYSPLVLAVDYPNGFLVEELLNRGAQRFQGRRPPSALLLAINRETPDIARLLIRNGADVNVREESEGLSALLMASHHGYTELAADLLAAGADIHASDHWGYRPMMKAAAYGHSEILRGIVQHDNDANYQNAQGISAAYLAAQNGHLECLQLLVSVNAQFDAARDDGVTALMAACYKGHYGVVKYLLDVGANVHNRSNEGLTAFDYVSDPEIATLFRA